MAREIIKEDGYFGRKGGNGGLLNKGWIHQMFYQFVSRVFSTNLSQSEQLKIRTTFLLVQNSSFNHN